MTRRRGTLGVLGLALMLSASALLAGCTRFGPACALSIAAIPSGAGAVPGQRLPAGAVVLASPADFDPRKASWGEGTAGMPTVTVHMLPEATARTAGYTADHVGVPMAIAIDKTIFVVTDLAAPITDGIVTVVPATPDEAARLPKLFEGCVATPTPLPSAGRPSPASSGG